MDYLGISYDIKNRPALDSGFIPFAPWRSAYLSVDGGRAFKILSGDRVEVRMSRQVTRLAKLTGRSFYELVHQKLGRGWQT